MARFRRVLKTVGKTSIPRAKMEAAVRSVLGPQITLDASERGVRALEKMVFTLDTPVQITFPKIAKYETVLIVDKNGDFTTGLKTSSKTKMEKLFVEPSGSIELVGEKTGARRGAKAVAERNAFGKAHKGQGLAVGVDTGPSRRRW